MKLNKVLATLLALVLGLSCTTVLADEQNDSGIYMPNIAAAVAVELSWILEDDSREFFSDYMPTMVDFNFLVSLSEAPEKTVGVEGIYKLENDKGFIKISMYTNQMDYDLLEVVNVAVLSDKAYSTAIFVDVQGREYARLDSLNVTAMRDSGEIRFVLPSQFTLKLEWRDGLTRDFEVDFEKDPYEKRGDYWDLHGYTLTEERDRDHLVPELVVIKNAMIDRNAVTPIKIITLVDALVYEDPELTIEVDWLMGAGVETEAVQVGDAFQLVEEGEFYISIDDAKIVP